jgi:amidase
MEAQPWQEVASKHQAIRDAAIPKEWQLFDVPSVDVANVMQIPYTCGILSDQELEWTDKDATELLELLATQKMKSYDLTLAFCKRASLAQQLVSSSHITCVE